MLSVFPVFQTHNLIYFKLEQQTMKLLPSALAILLPPFVSSSASGGVSSGEDAGGAVVGRAGRRRLVGDYPKTSTSTAIDDGRGSGDDDRTPIYGGGTSQTLITAPSSFSSSSSSKDYRSIRPYGFWNEDGDDNAIASGKGEDGGSELATIATVVTITTHLRGAGTGDAVSNGLVHRAGIGGDSGKVCMVGGW